MPQQQKVTEQTGYVARFAALSNALNLGLIWECKRLGASPNEKDHQRNSEIQTRMGEEKTPQGHTHNAGTRMARWTAGLNLPGGLGCPIMDSHVRASPRGFELCLDRQTLWRPLFWKGLGVGARLCGPRSSSRSSSTPGTTPCGTPTSLYKNAKASQHSTAHHITHTTEACSTRMLTASLFVPSTMMSPPRQLE